MGTDHSTPDQYHEPFKPREELSWDEFIRRIENSCNNYEKVSVIVNNNNCLDFKIQETRECVSEQVVERVNVTIIIDRKPIRK